jgi:DNA-binding GntR family transcriptional regulator
VNVRLTESELAERIGRSVGFARSVLEQLEREGLAAHDIDNFWSLTPEGERRFGKALRDLRFAS